MWVVAAAGDSYVKAFPTYYKLIKKKKENTQNLPNFPKPNT